MLCLWLCLLLLQLQFPDRADVLALMRRHLSWPGPGSGTHAAAAAAAAEQVGSAGAFATAPDSPPATDTEDGDSDSDSDGADVVSDDAPDDMQDEVLQAAGRVPRGARSRTYNAQERAVMRELKLNHLANVTRKTLKTGGVRWSVILSAEGLLRKTRMLQGESSHILSGRELWALVGMSLIMIPYDCLTRHRFRPVGICD
jgi:hypothetical protein